MAYKRNAPIPVIESGTGVTTMTTAYAPVCAGTTATGALQVASTGLSTSGYILTSNGASAVPSFLDFPILMVQGTTGIASGATAITLTGSPSGAVFTASGSTLTESFNYLALPTTTSVNGQITINSSPYFHAYGTDNIYMGKSAGNFTLTAIQDVGIGSSALSSRTSGSGASVAIGYQALKAATSASTNVGIGYQAGLIATTSTGDTFIGALAFKNATANSSTAIGYQAGLNATGNNAVTCIGANALSGANVSGNSTVAIGSGTLTGITSGGSNVAFGYNAGSSLTTGDSSTISINNNGTGGANTTCRIGAGTGTGTQQLNQTFIHGIFGTTTVNNNAIAVLIDSAGQLGTVSSSIRYKENVQDMGSVSSDILKARPVTFDFIGKPSHKRQVGLIAEEVKEIMPDLVAYNIDGDIESVKYQDISILLLNEIKKALERVKYLESKLI